MRYAVSLVVCVFLGGSSVYAADAPEPLASQIVAGGLFQPLLRDLSPSLHGAEYEPVSAAQTSGRQGAFASLSGTYLTMHTADWYGPSSTPSHLETEEMTNATHLNPLPSSGFVEEVQPLGGAEALMASRTVATAPEINELRRIAPAPQVAGPGGRPNGFHVLAATYVALTTVDSVTTAVGLRRGLEEKNPVLAPLGSHPAALLAAKTAITGATILLAERLWKSHRVSAIVALVAANVTTGFVVAHNIRLAQSVGRLR